jgi:GNAT superfamily N-acetyltransferase
MPPVEVVRTYLELDADTPLQPRPWPAGDARVVRLAPGSVDAYRRLYRTVGERWHWRDRLALDDDELRALLADPDIAVWELLVDGESAGYFELRREPGGDVEIAYFGLAPAFIGRGLGGALLTRAVEEARALGARRVWLHTCTLDSPHALPNYRARGFRAFRTERYVTEL